MAIEGRAAHHRVADVWNHRRCQDAATTADRGRHGFGRPVDVPWAVFTVLRGGYGISGRVEVRLTRHRLRGARGQHIWVASVDQATGGEAPPPTDWADSRTCPQLGPVIERLLALPEVVQAFYSGISEPPPAPLPHRSYWRLELPARTASRTVLLSDDGSRRLGYWWNDAGHILWNCRSSMKPVIDNHGQPSAG